MENSTLYKTNATICCRHFEDDDYRAPKGKHLLLPYVVPTKFLHLKKCSTTKRAQGDYLTNPPIKKKFCRGIRMLRQEFSKKFRILALLRAVRAVSKAKNIAPSRLQEEMTTWIRPLRIAAAKSHLCLTLHTILKLRQKTHAWSSGDKTVALIMFKHTLKIYRFLRKVIHLPAVRPRINWLKLNTEVNPLIIRNLMEIGQRMDDKSLYCSLTCKELLLSPCLVYDHKFDKVLGSKISVALAGAKKSPTARLFFSCRASNRGGRSPWGFISCTGKCRTLHSAS